MIYWNPDTKKLTHVKVRDGRTGKDISTARLWWLWLKYWLTAARRDRP